MFSVLSPTRLRRGEMLLKTALPKTMLPKTMLLQIMTSSCEFRGFKGVF
jgi:hypothetical protein